MNPKEVLETMKELSVMAGTEILKRYRKDIRIEYKEDRSPVTEADKAANQLIVEGLKRAYPNIKILAEESVDDSSRLDERYCFIVDPLDGTKEFINGSDEFTVNIALTEEGRPIAGVIYIPVLKELYFAAENTGAYSLINGKESSLAVSQRVKNIRLAKSRTHQSSELDRLIRENNIENIVIAGSSYKGCLLARGDVEAYYRFGRTMEWDTCAMEIIITEAGGYFYGMDGRLMRYNKPNPENPVGFYALNKIENALAFIPER